MNPSPLSGPVPAAGRDLQVGVRLTLAKLSGVLPLELLHALVLYFHPPSAAAVLVLAVATKVLVTWVWSHRRCACWRLYCSAADGEAQGTSADAAGWARRRIVSKCEPCDQARSTAPAQTHTSCGCGGAPNLRARGRRRAARRRGASPPRTDASAEPGPASHRSGTATPELTHTAGPPWMLHR